MRFIWLREAGRDRDRIFEQIAKDNLTAAGTNDARIGDIERQLVYFPYSGRVGRVAGTRELVVSGTPYIAVYAVRDDRIEVVNVIHGAQQWPPRSDR